MAVERKQTEIRPASAQAGAQSDALPSVEETASMLDEKLYHMIYTAQQTVSHAQQVITIGQQGRSEVATLRYICTITLQKYRGCRDAYKALYERHKGMAAELERLKNQKVQERTSSEVRDMEEIKQLEAKIALVEEEKQELLQDKANVKEDYENALINAGNRIQSQEKEPKSLGTVESVDLESPLVPIINVQSLKRGREIGELQQEEPTKKSRRGKISRLRGASGLEGGGYTVVSYP
ncbi:hypothetical protein K469DRAFT_752108 [Zopfia rhizophila CBS 207.26]|uniref:Uncharacterized protein n=1 Tax=Zopfia rhizophila CBS 207.26 TaxID=1314779 RepID=A0A6A6DSN5_9PEZI|nr:hypothetical protein K469DRAFT_752108 [Zopfia rhizophila CBS 207.26]